jgi:AcrR family transcriptional regulator
VNVDEIEPKQRLTRAEAKARTRALLLDAAAHTFARKGFAAASVEEIAEAAGFSVGALYSNFKSKEQLFIELMATRSSGKIAEAAQIVGDGHAWGDGNAMQALGRLLAKSADEDADVAPLQAEFWLYAVRNRAALDTLAEQLRGQRDGLNTLVESVLERRGGSARARADAVATVVRALFHGLVRQRRIDPASVPDELFGRALQWLFTGVVATEQDCAGT